MLAFVKKLLRRGSDDDREGRDTREGGFTLLELLVVLVILGLIGTLVAPRVMGLLGRAKGDVARIQIENLATSLDLFRLDVGRYPTASEGLPALVVKPSGLDRWNGPYIDGTAAPEDPWGRAYVYEARGEGGRPYRIVSLGADGKPGGEGEDADVAGP